MAPGEIDLGFLKSFSYCLKKYLNSRRFFIFVGGGKPARNYQKALLEFGADSQDRDWMGIKISRLNAEIVKQAFLGNAFSEIITDPTKKIKTVKPIIVGAGWKPGWSTDYVSVICAKTYNIKTVVNLTNIDYVCDKDPSKFPDAKCIKETTWGEFRKIVGDKWEPGLSKPFDPRASYAAGKLNLKVAIINGKNLERLEDFLNNKPFVGTIIK